MRRLDRFLISKRPYAVDLASLRTRIQTRTDGAHFWTCNVDAVWFRKKNDLLAACVGALWDLQAPEPPSVEKFMEQHTDGRYGGTTMGRWDGERYWGNGVTLETQQEHLEILRPMLEHYPDVPADYDGWWTFASRSDR